MMKMNFINYKYLGSLLFLLFFSANVSATHVIGGNVLYRCLGNDQYEITVEFAVDCALGDGAALALDSFATVKVFDTNNNWLTDLGDGGEWVVEVQDVIRLGDPNVACRVLNNPVCVQRQRYVQVVTLPFNPDGYIISFRRCCRNITLLNVTEPLDTGATYWVEITPEAQMECNTSARFKSWPDVYLCANEDLEFDASAIDIDGDSLVYKLCVPTEGGADLNSLSSAEYFPPFDEVTFETGFDVNNFLGVGSPLSIDPNTGLLTANAQMIGQFLIGICVEEYRDGVKISETRRDFEYNVRLCTDPPTADFSVAPNPNCQGLELTFENMSTSTQGNDLSYEWFFDFTQDSIMSTDENPTFMFPTGGSYDVVLVTFDGICQDTAFATVGVAEPGDPSPNFDLEVVAGCDDGEIELQLINQSSNTVPIETWNWTVTSSEGVQTFDVQNPPNFIIDGAQTITVNLEANSIIGCSASFQMDFDIIGIGGFVLDPFIDNFQTTACAGITTILNPNADPANTYTWTSSDPNVSINPNDPSPSVVITQVTTFTVEVLDPDGCSETGSVTISPLAGPTLDPMISDFQAIQCTEMAVLLNPNANPAYTYSWVASDPNVAFNPNDPSPSVLVTQLTTFTVTVTDIDGCTAIGSVTVNPVSGPPINIINSLVQCEGDSVSLYPGFDPSFVYNWESEPPGVLSDPTDPNPTVSVDVLTMFNVTVTDPNNPACTSTSFVNVLFAPNPILEVVPDSVVVLCEGETQFYDVTTDGNSIVWLNADGDTLTVEEDFEIAAEDPGDYTIIASTLFGCTTTQVVTVNQAIVEDIIVTSSTGSDLFCSGDEVVLTASTENINVSDLEWMDANGNVIGTGEMLTVFPSDDTSYFVTGVTDDGCIVNGEFDLILSDINVQISGPDIICDNEESTLTATVIEGENVTFNWQPEGVIIGSNTDATITIDPFDNPTIFTLTSTNDNGCESVSTYAVSLLTVGNIEIVADPQEFFFGQSTQLSVTPNLPGYMYEWSPSEDLDDPFSPTPIVTPSESGELTYTVTVTSPDGCVDSESITLSVGDAECVIENFHVPNMFTPNGDGHNDVFEVFTNVVDDFRLTVFDRWGEEVFDTETSGQRTWDGTFLGEELTPDVYGYCVRVSCSEGEDFVKTGNVTLVK